jgi:hypothetical protein
MIKGKTSVQVSRNPCRRVVSGRQEQDENGLLADRAQYPAKAA